jgi:hypothetical protein
MIYGCIFQTGKSKLLDVTFWVMNTAAVMAPMFHFIAAFLLMPPYTGYFINSAIQAFQQGRQEDPPISYFNVTLASLPIRLLSGSFALVTSAPSAPRAITVSVVDILFGTLSVRQSLDSLERRLLVSGKRTTEDMLGIMKNLKAVQLLVQRYNKMYAHLYYSNTIAVGGTALITFAVGAINLRKEMPLFGIAGFAGLSFCGLLFISVSLTAAGRVRVGYEHLIRKVKVKKAFSQSRLLRRVVKCSAPLKVKIGSVNFVDRATAGVFLMFAVEQIGSLAMIS